MAHVNDIEIWNIENSIKKSKTTVYRIKNAGIEKIVKVIKIFKKYFEHNM